MIVTIPKVEAALTEKGMGIKTVINAMYAWGEKELQADYPRDAIR